MAGKPMSPKAKEAVERISDLDLTDEEVGEVIGALIVKTIGGALGDALGELGL